MKTSGETESVSMPSSLLAEVQVAANEEHRTREELLLEAVERYLRIPPAPYMFCHPDRGLQPDRGICGSSRGSGDSTRDIVSSGMRPGAYSRGLS